MNKKKIVMSILTPLILIGTTIPAICAFSSSINVTGVKANPIPTSKHGYNSITTSQQNEYYPSIQRESITLASNYHNSFPDADYSAIDRNRYVYYPESTSIYIYDLNEDGEYADISINVSGNDEILDGFAYIANDSNDPLANTFINVFAGDTQLATYFACGEDPFTTYCTSQSLIDFLYTISFDHTLHLSQLLANDNQRDNAILSLLNPKIWDIWLNAAKENSNLKIDYIDLSNNKLMVYPNLASIPSLYNNNIWMFNDKNYVGDNPELLMNDYSRSKDPSSTAVYGGYFKGIDLSHNDFLYFNSWSYITVNDSRQNSNNYYDYFPSLLTIVHPIYSFDDMKKIFIDLSEPAKLDGYYGVNLDYNHLTYIAYGDVGSWNTKSYLEYQASSWYEAPLEFTVASTVRIRYSYMRCFMTYTVANASNKLVYEIEYLLGWGVYQTDTIISNEKYLTNWFKSFDPGLYEMLSNTYASSLTTQMYMVLQYHLYALFESFPFSSVPIYAEIISGNPMTRVTYKYAIRYGLYNDLDGVSYLPVYTNLYRVSYIPNDFDLPSGSTDINKLIDALVSEVMSTVTVNDLYVMPLSIYKKNYKSWAIIGFTFMMFALIIIGLFGIKFAQNVKKTKMKRGHYDDEE